MQTRVESLVARTGCEENKVWQLDHAVEINDKFRKINLEH